MYRYYCKNCGKYSYSASPQAYLNNNKCPYCGHPNAGDSGSSTGSKSSLQTKERRDKKHNDCKK